MVPISLLVVFLLLCSSFNHFGSFILILLNIPLLFSSGTGSEVQRPLATVVVRRARHVDRAHNCS